MYGPHNWFYTQTNYAQPLNKFEINPHDRIIQHLIELPSRPNCKKIVLSCHEKLKFKDCNTTGYDEIRFVSQDQKEWQGMQGVIVPNLIRGIDKVLDPPRDIAGVIGSISPRKQTHRSICRAIADGYDVLVYGPHQEAEYFERYVRPLFSLENVTHKGLEMDKNKIYQSISVVYHSGEDESACRVFGECQKAGIPFRSNLPPYDMWSENQIKKAWFTLLEL